jgi:hypothetical protein
MALGNLNEAAQEFVHSGYDLSPASIGRHTDGAFAIESTQRVWLVTDAQRGELRTMSIETFIGGVAYSLAEREEIDPKEVSLARVHGLCARIHALLGADRALTAPQD